MPLNAISFQQVGNLLYRKKVPFLYRIIDMMVYLIFNCSIPSKTSIGTGTMCEHRGVGVVIHHDAIIGKNCHIFAHVVVGGKGFGIPGTPCIGDNVIIGSGAKILGAVKVGDNAVIGANAVVTKDVPDNAVAMGIPAQITRFLNQERKAEQTAAK